MSRTFRSFGIASSLLVLVAFVLTAAPASAHANHNHRPFLFGATWDDAMSPASKQLFLESGCNYARLSGGGFGWSLALHRKELAELRGHGIYTMLQLGSHWPDGSYSVHSEDFLVDQLGNTGKVANGTVDYSGEDWPQYTYASPEYRARLEKDFTTYLDQLTSDPSVIQLLLHNEPGYHWIQNRIFDYNPKSIAAFRLWLPSQHKDIAALNESWGTNFESFAQVDPPRQLPPVANIAGWMDWRRFNVYLIEKFLTWEEKFAKGVCPNLPSETNMPGPLDNWYPVRLSDNYRFTEPFDSAAVDIYAGDWTNRYYVGYAMDMTRGAAEARPITIAECDPYDPSEYHSLNSQQGADRMRSDVWRYIGHGAKAVLLWTWGSPGASEVTTGEFNDRVLAARDIAHLTKMLNVGDFSSPQRHIALVADQDAFLYYDGIGSQRDGAMRCEASLQGLYSALAGDGFAVDIISADQVRSGVASRYRALVLATPAITDNRLSNSLSTFMDRGGVVVAEAPLGEFDKWGKSIAPEGSGLQKLFGVQVVKAYDDGGTQAISAFGFQGKGREHVRLAGAQARALFEDGSPAVTQISRGQGKGILIATDVGVLNSDDAHPALGRFLLNTIEADTGIKPAVVAASDSYLDSSLLVDKPQGNQLIVVTNPTDKLQPPAVHEDVAVLLRSALPSSDGQLFMIDHTHTVAGRTSAGPHLAPMPAAVNGVLRIPIGRVDSASVMMIARDHDPLLEIEGPTKAAQGSTVQIDVTCYNPSPKPISGALRAVPPPGWNLVGSQEPVKISARGEVRVKLAMLVGPTSGRSVVKATFTDEARGESVDSVPIDVMVDGAPAGG